MPLQHAALYLLVQFEDVVYQGQQNGLTQYIRPPSRKKAAKSKELHSFSIRISSLPPVELGDLSCLFGDHKKPCPIDGFYHSTDGALHVAIVF